MKNLPALSSIDQANKLKLWFTEEVIDQGNYDVHKLYDLLEQHFNLMAKLKDNNK